MRAHTLNLVLRLRARYVESGQREEQLAHALAEAAGPLRVAAASLLRLQDAPATAPKAALAQFAQQSGIAGADAALQLMTQARGTPFLPPGTAVTAFHTILQLAHAVQERAEALVP